MTVSQTEDELKLELMKMDLDLKTKQAFWETPRNIAILVATVGALCTALGFKLGQHDTQPQHIVVDIHQTGK